MTTDLLTSSPPPQNDVIRVALPPRQWTLLEAFCRVPDGKHTSGGLQNHRRKWKQQIDARLAHLDKWERGSLKDPALRFIDLDAHELAFVHRTIANANGGGFQSQVADIFADTAPEFTGVERTKKR